MSDEKLDLNQDSESEERAKTIEKEAETPAKREFGILAAKFLKKTAKSTTTGDYPTVDVKEVTIAPREKTDDDDLVFNLDDIDEPAQGSDNSYASSIRKAAIPSDELGHLESESLYAEQFDPAAFETKYDTAADDSSKKAEPVNRNKGQSGIADAKPVAKVAAPVVKVAEPVAKVAEPVAKVTEPVAKVAEPVAKVAEPVAKVTEPVAKVAEPAAKVAEPVAKVAETVAKVAEPVDELPEPVLDVLETTAEQAYESDSNVENAEESPESGHTEVETISEQYSTEAVQEEEQYAEAVRGSVVDADSEYSEEIPVTQADIETGQETEETVLDESDRPTEETLAERSFEAEDQERYEVDANSERLESEASDAEKSDSSSEESAGETGTEISITNAGSPDTAASDVDAPVPIQPSTSPTAPAVSKRELDAIASPGASASKSSALDTSQSVSEPKSKDQPSSASGLLGGSLGRKAKSFLDKKSSGISTTSAALEQRDTGKFILENQFKPLPSRQESLAQPAPEPIISPQDSLAPEPEVAADTDTDTGASASTESTADESIEADNLAGSALLDSEETTEESTVGTESDAETEPAQGRLSEATEALLNKAYVSDTKLPAQGEPARLIADADNAFKARQFLAAEPIYARALEKLEKSGADNEPLMAACLDKAGDNLLELRKYKEALPLFRKLVILHEKLSSSDRDLISAMYKIAKTSESLNLTAEADSMYKRAFRLGQQSLVPGDPLLATVLEGYGNMLMRNENGGAAAEAEPKSAPAAAPKVAPKPSATISTVLSPEEIALLNRLEIKKDDSPRSTLTVPAATAPSPITPPPSPPPSVDSTRGPSSNAAKRSTLREQDERVKYRPPSESGPPGTGSMAIRTILFVCIILGALQWVKTLNADFSARKPPEIKIIPGPYNGKVYTALDGRTIVSFLTDTKGFKDFLGTKITYDYKAWGGKFSDDLDILSGKISDKDFAFIVDEGFRDQDKNLYYRTDAPETEVVKVMKDTGAKAQAFYKAHGHYPSGAELAKALQIPYKNAFVNGPEKFATNTIKWPKDLDPKQIFVLSKFDKNLDDGGTWEGEQNGKPGEISIMSSHNESPPASVLYIHGRDRHGDLLRRSDKKILLLVFKNGLDMTPIAASPIIKDNKPVPLRVTKDPIAANVFTVLCSYIPIIGFFVAACGLGFLWIQRRIKMTQGPTTLPFATIWSAIMCALCVAPKFAPEPYSQYCVYAALPAFILGLVVMFLHFQRYQPKTKKPPKESTT